MRHAGIPFKRLMICFITGLALSTHTFAEVRTWTYLTGETFEGEYVKKLFDDVVIKDADGKEQRIPLKQLTREDDLYVQLENPPKLSVDPLENFDQRDPTPSPIWVNNSPVKCLMYSFGARVKQPGLEKYEHDMTVVVYVFTQQVFDISKYRLIAKVESEPFRLTKENGYRFEFRETDKHRVLSWLIAETRPRGQKFAETLIVVKDVRGNVIAYNSTKKWLYKGLDRLEKLPIGAWIDDKVERVHPTSPKRDL